MWLYKGKELTQEDIEGYDGMIYLISNLFNGKRYCGKKTFVSNRRKPLTKTEKVGTRKKFKRVVTESNWKDYWGSCKPLLADIEQYGTEMFIREVIKLCPDRINTTYWECHYLMMYGVLFNDNWYNTNILSKFFQGRIIE